MPTSLEAIDERYFYLTLRYNDLIDKCAGDGNQEATVDSEFTAATDAHNEALDKIFSENAATVVNLRNSLVANTADLKRQMDDDEQIVEILNTLTTGGQLAKNLVSQGSSA
jgi:hypothetical protein